MLHIQIKNHLSLNSWTKDEFPVKKLKTWKSKFEVIDKMGQLKIFCRLTKQYSLFEAIFSTDLNSCRINLITPKIQMISSTSKARKTFFCSVWLFCHKISFWFYIYWETASKNFLRHLKLLVLRNFLSDFEKLFYTNIYAELYIF